MGASAWKPARGGRPSGRSPRRDRMGPMRWTILAVGKLKEAHWQAAAAEYLKRLGPYRPVEMVELQDEKADPGQTPALIDQARRREGERILAAVRPGSGTSSASWAVAVS